MPAPTIPANARSKRPPWLLIGAAAALYLLAGLLTLHNDHNWGDDWAQYVGHARNIALGRPYADTGYIFNPQSPWVGPQVSQPGLPAVLAPVYALFGQNLIALKAIEFLLLTAGCIVAAATIADTLGWWAALLVTAMFGLHPDVLWLRQVILTEPLYIFCSFAALLAAKHRFSAASPRRTFVMSVLTGLLMVGAFSARATGSALIAAVVVWDVVNRRRLLTATLPILIVFAAGVFGLRASTGVADYSTQLTSAAQQERSTTPLLVATSQRVGEYFNVLGSAVHAPHGLTKLVTVVLGTLFVTGIVSVCARRRALAQAQPLRARLLAWVAACPLEFWYLGAYMSALFVLALRPEMRTLLPVLPIFIAAIVAGAQALLSLRPNTYLRRATVAAALLLILALNVHLRDGTFSTRANHDEGDNGAFCRDCRQLYSFISAQTPAEARIAFAKPRALALLTSRKGWMWSPTAPESVTWEAMRTIHIEYVVVPREGYVLSSLYPDYLSWRTFEQRPGLAQIFANDTFRVYRIDWQP